MAALMRSLRDLNRGGVICDLAGWRLRLRARRFLDLRGDRGGRTLECRQIDQRRRHDGRRHVHGRRRRRLVEIFRRRRRRRQVHDREILRRPGCRSEPGPAPGPRKRSRAGRRCRRKRPSCENYLRNRYSPYRTCPHPSSELAGRMPGNPGHGPCQISSRRAFMRAPIPATATLAVGRIDCKRRAPPV